MINGRVIEFPQYQEPDVAMFPTYYDAKYDEVSIPRLPADSDTAAAILATWAKLLTGYGVLTPNECYETMDKVFHRRKEDEN